MHEIWKRHLRACAFAVLLAAGVAALVIWLQRADAPPSAKPPGSRATVRPEPVRRPRRVRVAPQSTSSRGLGSESEPAPEPREEPASEPAHPPLVAVTVQDLWDGSPVTGLSFELHEDLDEATRDALGVSEQTDSGAWLLTTDDEGVLRLPTDLTAANPEGIDSAWRVLPTSRPTRDGPPVIWVYRTLRVTGSVRAVDWVEPLALDTVEIRTRMADRPPRAHASAPDQQELSNVGIGGDRLVCIGTQSGAFSYELPLVGGTTIVARPPVPDSATRGGWREATYTITQEDASAGHARVDLVLERGFELDGRLVDENGEPVAGAALVFHVVHRVDKERLLDRAWLRRFGIGYSARWNPSMASAVVDYTFRATSGDDGGFSVAPTIDGELIVEVIPTTEHHVGTYRVGGVSSYKGLEAFVLTSADAAGLVRVVGEHGQSFAGRRVSFVDLSEGDIQPNVARLLDDESRVPARCLVRGHEYNVSVRGDSGTLPLADAIVTWNGERELRIGPLRLGGRASHAGSE